jgi:hypothetical protein
MKHIYKSLENFDYHSLLFLDGKYVDMYFYPVKNWIPKLKIKFFGFYCPILAVDTPWFELFADFRPVTSNVVRDSER